MRPQHEYEEALRWIRWGLKDCAISRRVCSSNGDGAWDAFVSYSKDIRQLFCWACDLYGVDWRQMKWNMISIARREDVAKLDKVVGLKK